MISNNPCGHRVVLFSATAVMLVLCPAAESLGQGSRELVERQLDSSRLLYTTPAAWAVRRAALREGFLKGARLWPLPEKTPLNPIRHSRRDHDGYTVENVALETMPGFWCTGNLYLPRDRSKKCAAVLCPHGHFRPLGRFREEHQVRCAHLARMGAAVFSYAMVGWQDSTQTTHQDPLVLALQTWNSVRAIDFLTSLNEVDPQRVGVTGASGGGTQSLYLTLVDDRVKVSAPVVIVYPWAAPDGCVCEGGMPVMQATQTNAIELAAAAAPRPQLLISVARDPTEDFPKVGFPFIKHVYELHGRSDAVANVHFPEGGHDYGPAKRRALYAFFAKHLQLEIKEEDAKTIAIESPEQLRVFDDTHPRPRHAVRGSAEVARAFDSLKRPVKAPANPQLVRVEAALFTPDGFTKEGAALVASGPMLARLNIVVRDGASGRPTCCRINVVGPDGDFYQPQANDLTPYAFTGQWPRVGRGNREGKGPSRYYGRFFYSRGQSSVEVPAGPVRVEVWKGIEFQPQTRSLVAAAGATDQVEIKLSRTAAMTDAGYYSGDPHLHLRRQTEADDQVILDLLEAEDIHYGSILAYNEPAGPYAGIMDRLDYPQFRGLGAVSVRRRGSYQIVSGQEYRSSTYGHLNLYLRDDLVVKESRGNADFWPLYGDLGRETQRKGGYAFYAHGGYAQAIYADFVQGDVNGVELLQFGVYRGIGLEDWYRMLNTGYRFPCIAASDYPACRKLGDCLTYVRYPSPPTFAEWFQAAAEGRSFVSTGPLLLLEVDGKKPGDIIRKNDHETRKVTAKVRVLSEVAPVTHVHLIVNGKVVHEITVPSDQAKGAWIELKQPVEVVSSSWIAARAYSKSPLGEPDAEAHTNPVYVYVNGARPYDPASLDVLLQRIDGQIQAHRKREFPEKLRLLEYFEKSRDRLVKLRQAGGWPAEGKITSAIDPSARTHTEQELREFLKPVPPKPPAEAVKTFDTVGNFRMELVAAEPLVHSPVAAAFDENGRLYVAELIDYPYLPRPGQKPLGTIRLLEDSDGDGVFDKSTVFADGLLWAAGIVPWKGGIFAAAPPDIWYLKDTHGDGKADLRKKVFTGFSTKNPQGIVNNLVLGLDHKIYGTTSVNGGTVRPGGDDKAPGIRVDGKDFRFDPETLRFETVTGTVQFGNTFDDWGSRFLCSESQPLLHVVLPQHYLARNPSLPVASAILNLAPAPVPIYRISEPERWRIIRSARRIAHGERPANMPGASHYVVDAAAGVTVYRGGAYPKEYYGLVFVGDAQNNLVHRRTLTADGVTFKSARADDKTEFVRSTDSWFRPVNFVNAPDGSLYVLDLSREILEAIHIPLDVMKFIDLTHGRDTGRIYRLAPPGFRYPGAPHLGSASGAELIAALESPHGWWRDTAHRLIYERQDKSFTEPLRQLVRNSRLPQARLHSLWSLHGLGTVDDPDIVAGLTDTVPGVRENAVRLAEPRLNQSAELRQRVLALVDDPDARVRFQVAFTLGEVTGQAAVTALTQLARQHAADPWMRTAILSSATASAQPMLTELLADASFANGGSGPAFLEQLALVVGVRNRPDEVQRALGAMAQFAGPERNVTGRFVLSLGDGLKRAGARLPVPNGRTAYARQLLDRSLTTAADAKAAEPERLQAVRLLSCYPLERTRNVLAALLDPRQPPNLQVAAVRALADQPEAEIAPILLGGWTQYVPAVREAALHALLSREPWTLALLRAAEQGQFSAGQIDSTRRQLLLAHRNAAISGSARKLFAGDQPNARKDVLADYQAALKLAADRTRGHAIFQKHCLVCHKIGSEGFAVGPDLTSSSHRDPAALLTHILDPNQYVLPNYVQYLVVDKSGRNYTGVIAAETATSITLRRESLGQDTLLRDSIEEMTSTGKSLMPEGFEKQVGKQEMADLLAFLLSVQAPPRLDIGTEGGMVEPGPE